MKIKSEHYEYMKESLQAFCEANKEEIARHIRDVKEGGRYKDLRRRIYWDIFAAAKLSLFACDNIYSYANDDHIYTALKNILKDRIPLEEGK